MKKLEGLNKIADLHRPVRGVYNIRRCPECQIVLVSKNDVCLTYKLATEAIKDNS